MPALATTRAAGLPKEPRFHDLRHTYVAWAVASSADLPYIQAQLGHESITTTIDTYGHLMPNSNRHVTHVFYRAMRGGKIERYEGREAEPRKFACVDDVDVDVQGSPDHRAGRRS